MTAEFSRFAACFVLTLFILAHVQGEARLPSKEELELKIGHHVGNESMATVGSHGNESLHGEGYGHHMNKSEGVHVLANVTAEFDDGSHAKAHLKKMRKNESAEHNNIGNASIHHNESIPNGNETSEGLHRGNNHNHANVSEDQFWEHGKIHQNISNDNMVHESNHSAANKSHESSEHGKRHDNSSESSLHHMKHENSSEHHMDHMDHTNMHHNKSNEHVDHMDHSKMRHNKSGEHVDHMDHPKMHHNKSHESSEHEKMHGNSSEHHMMMHHANASAEHVKHGSHESANTSHHMKESFAHENKHGLPNSSEHSESNKGNHSNFAHDTHDSNHTVLHANLSAETLRGGNHSEHNLTAEAHLRAPGKHANVISNIRVGNQPFVESGESTDRPHSTVKPVALIKESNFKPLKLGNHSDDIRHPLTTAVPEKDSENGYKGPIRPNAHFAASSGLWNYCKAATDCYSFREPNEWCPQADGFYYRGEGCFCDPIVRGCVIERTNGNLVQWTFCSQAQNFKCSNYPKVN